MINEIKKFEEIAEYLKNKKCMSDLKVMKESILEKKFLLSFVGQFSAGKSKLINNLLGTELLPVHIIETTQVATFIKYANENKASIYYKTGRVEFISIETVKEIWEGNSGEQRDNIDYIEIGINSPVLKDGLVLGDTPGINTTIKRHEDVTRNILKTSEGCVYVISKPITEVDKLFMRELIDSGLKLICVRTYMDAINSSEEDPLEAVRRDTEVINSIGEGNISSTHHVSNEEGNEWYERIDDIRSYIENNLAANIEAELEKSCEAKLECIADEFLVELENKKDVLEDIIQGNESSLNERKEKIARVLKNFEATGQQKKSKYLNDTNIIKEKALREVKAKGINLKRKFSTNVNSIEYVTGREDDIKDLMYKELYASSKTLQEVYLNEFENFIRDNRNELIQDMDLDILDIHSNALIPDGVNSLVLQKEEGSFEVERMKRSLMELSESLEHKEIELSKLNVNSKEYAEQKMQIDAIFMDLEGEIRNLGPYIPQYREALEQGIKPSKVLKVLGCGLDWGLMLLPPAAYTGIAAKVGKGSAVLGKVIKGMGEADTIKDGLFALKNIGDTINRTRKTAKRTEKVLKAANIVKKAGIFDLVTFEYWGEKLGSKFDSPVKMEIDREYELEYKRQKEDLREKYNKAKFAELRYLQDLGMIKDEQDRLAKQKEIEARKMIELQRDLQFKEREIARKAEQKAFETLKNKYIEKFNEAIDELMVVVVNKCNEILQEPLEQYIERALVSINHKIKECYEINENIESEAASLSTSEVKEEYNKCIQYLDMLNGEN